MFPPVSHAPRFSAIKKIVVDAPASGGESSRSQGSGTRPSAIPADSAMSSLEHQAMDAAIDHFSQALTLPSVAARALPPEEMGTVFTEQVYQQVRQGMAKVRSMRLRDAEERARALKKTLIESGLGQRFEIGKVTMHPLEGKPSIVLLIPKPVSQKQFLDLTTNLNLRWLDAQIPAGNWIVDMNNLKRIYCSSDPHDMAALRLKHAANSAPLRQEMRELAKDIFTPSKSGQPHK